MGVKVTAAAVADGKLVVGGGLGELNVSVFCAQQGVSRKTFYKWVNRYRSEGVAGLEDRSRRPRSIPNQVSDEVEDLVVRLRKELADAGLDDGATTIQWHLGRRRASGEVSIPQMPSMATIWRILVRRFEASAANEWWQIDFTEWVLGDGTVVKIFNIIDDHCRVATRSRAVVSATSEEAWTTFGQASAIWGLPAGVLSDNGLCFSGKLNHFEAFFETRLRDAGIRPFTGRPYHPQTTGKVERFQQTLKKWLRKQPLAASLGELQVQLDQFVHVYNFERPHQGIGRAIPADRWQANPACGPAAEPLAHPDYSTRTFYNTIYTDGTITADMFTIHVGAEYSGMAAMVMTNQRHANVFINGQLVRHLELDRTRRYQPSGRPRGGPKRPRLQS